MNSTVRECTRSDGAIDLASFRDGKRQDQKPTAKASSAEPARPMTDRERLAKRQEAEGGNYRSLIDRSGKRTW